MGDEAISVTTEVAERNLLLELILSAAKDPKYEIATARFTGLAMTKALRTPRNDKKRNLAVFALGFLVFFFTLSRDAWASPTLSYSWKKVPIAYTVQGTGPALVLVHSADLGSSSAEWEAVRPFFDRDYQTYAVDLLGFGRSGRPRLPLTAALQEEFLYDFLRDVVQREAVLIASGLGAAYSVKVASVHPHWISQLVLVSPAGVSRLAHPPGPMGVLLYQCLRFPPVGGWIHRVMSSDTVLAIHYRDGFINPVSLRAYVERVAEPVKEKRAWPAIHSFVSGYLNEDIHRSLDNLDLPVLFVLGGTGPGVHREIRRFKNINPAVQVRVVPDSRRWPHIEQPGVFYETVSVFLKHRRSIAAEAVSSSS